MEDQTSPQTSNPVVNNEVTPPPHKPMLMHIAMGLVILAAGLVGGYYFAQSSKPIANSQTTPSPTLSPKASDEMEGWETYTDMLANWTIKYPPNLSIKITEPTKIHDDAGSGLKALNGSVSFTSDSYELILTMVGSGLGGGTCKETWKGELNQIQVRNHSISVCKLSNANLTNNFEKSKYSYSWKASCGDCSGIKNDSYTLLIEFNGNIDLEKSSEFNQILSTFEFVE